MTVLAPPTLGPGKVLSREETRQRHSNRKESHYCFRICFSSYLALAVTGQCEHQQTRSQGFMLTLQVKWKMGMRTESNVHRPSSLGWKVNSERHLSETVTFKKQHVYIVLASKPCPSKVACIQTMIISDKKYSFDINIKMSLPLTVYKSSKQNSVMGLNILKSHRTRAEIIQW